MIDLDQWILDFLATVVFQKRYGPNMIRRNPSPD